METQRLATRRKRARGCTTETNSVLSHRPQNNTIKHRHCQEKYTWDNVSQTSLLLLPCCGCGFSCWLLRLEQSSIVHGAGSCYSTEPCSWIFLPGPGRCRCGHTAAREESVAINERCSPSLDVKGKLCWQVLPSAGLRRSSPTPRTRCEIAAGSFPCAGCSHTSARSCCRGGAVKSCLPEKTLAGSGIWCRTPILLAAGVVTRHPFDHREGEGSFLPLPGK